MFLKKVLLFCLCCSSFLLLGSAEEKEPSFFGAIIGASIGDALGRITEFIDTTESIRSNYGISGLEWFYDFKPRDFVVIDNQKTACYTDDTVMSIVLSEELLLGKNKNLSVEQIIKNIASRFADMFGPQKYFFDKYYDLRAHGNTNILKGQMLYNEYKLINAHLESLCCTDRKKILLEGGCGSVMRAWPVGLVFYDDMEKLKRLAALQSKLTHRHPLAVASCVAVAVGMAELVNGKEPLDVVDSMVKASEEYDYKELLFKKNACKVLDSNCFNSSLVKNDLLLTSDMIRYAALMAKNGICPENVLGSHNFKGKNGRSTEGFLLGWAADESVSSAVYIFLRNPNNLFEALKEAINTPGDSDSIAVLVGAFVGLRTGINNIPSFEKLENLDGLQKISCKMENCFKKIFYRGN